MKGKIYFLRSNHFNHLFVILILVWTSSSLIAQDIDFDLACPNAPVVLDDQFVGTNISIPPIGAINQPGGAPVAMSIQNISLNPGGNFCGTPCVGSPIIVNGGPITTDVTFTNNGTD